MRGGKGGAGLDPKGGGSEVRPEGELRLDPNQGRSGVGSNWKWEGRGSKGKSGVRPKGVGWSEFRPELGGKGVE